MKIWINFERKVIIIKKVFYYQGKSSFSYSDGYTGHSEGINCRFMKVFNEDGSQFILGNNLFLYNEIVREKLILSGIIRPILIEDIKDESIRKEMSLKSEEVKGFAQKHGVGYEEIILEGEVSEKEINNYNKNLNE